MQRFGLSWTLLLVAGVAAGCVRSPVSAAKKPIPVAASAQPPGAASLRPGPALGTSVPPATGLVSKTSSSVIANNGGNIVANNGGSLTGAVSVPAGLITDLGSGVIANNGGSLAARSSLRVLDIDTRPASAGVEVRLVDAEGHDILDDAGKPFVTTTDARGHYDFPQSPGGRHVLVSVSLGKAGALLGIGTKDRSASATVDLDLASTLSTAYIVAEYVQPQADAVHVLDRLSGDVERQTLDTMRASLTSAKAAVPSSLAPAQVVATVDALRQQDHSLDVQLDTVKKLLLVGGSASQTDGSAIAAALNQPRGLAFEADGTLYFADARNNLIRRLTTEGKIQTVAGSGNATNVDGKGTAASFNTPFGVALDGGGALYVTCVGAVIRRVNLADGTVTTIAGGSAQGHRNGPGSTAAFHNPLGLVVDRRDPNHLALYVADANNRRVRKVDLMDPTYPVTDLAGSGKAGSDDGPADTATFSNVQGLAVTPDGLLLIADTDNHKIRALDLTAAAPVVTTFAGSGQPGVADGPAASASFNLPAGLALTADNRLLVTDVGGDNLRAIDLVGAGHAVTTLVDGVKGFPDGAGTSTLYEPQCVAVDGHGNALVADTLNNRLREVTPAGVVTTVAGRASGNVVDGQGTGALLNQPRGVAVAGDGAVYVADTFSHAIRLVAPDGKVTTIAGNGIQGADDGPGAKASFHNPYNLVVDERDPTHRALIVADTTNNRIRRIDLSDPAYAVTTIAGTGVAGHTDGPGASATLSSPVALALDAAGQLYVGDSKNFLVRRIDLGDPSHPVTTIAGTGAAGADDGPGAQASFNLLYGFAIVNQALYMADTYNHEIRVLDLSDPAHTVSTFAGSVSPGHADGPASSATFNMPQSLALDGQGGLLVADSHNNLIRRIDLSGPDHTVTTFSGSPTTGASAGTAATATFSLPTAVAVGPDGHVYVADTQNNRVLDLGPEGSP